MTAKQSKIKLQPSRLQFKQKSQCSSFFRLFIASFWLGSVVAIENLFQESLSRICSQRGDGPGCSEKCMQMLTYCYCANRRSFQRQLWAAGFGWVIGFFKSCGQYLPATENHQETLNYLVVYPVAFWGWMFSVCDLIAVFPTLQSTALKFSREC